MKSVMPPQKDFSKVPRIGGIQRSVFNRSHGHKTTFNTDYLIPFYIDEILPGDDQDVRANIFARLSSALGEPIMDNLVLDTFFFYVPERLLWSNWEKFNGAQDDPADSIDFTMPIVDFTGGTLEATLEDYFGIEPSLGSGDDLEIRASWHRAYNLIWNDWFRDENLQDSVPVNLGDGPDDPADYTLLKRGKRPDYFTSCLPWAQKGDPVSIALTGFADVLGNGTTAGFEAWSGSALLQYGLYKKNDTFDYLALNNSIDGDPVNTTVSGGSEPANDLSIGFSDDPDKSGLHADMSSVAAIEINDLRLAIATQQLLEIDARGGTRYVEIIKSHFGVVVPDYRVQRPEYLGGGSVPININPITQTSQANNTSLNEFLGTQGAFGTMSSRSGYSKSFVEHGIIMGLVNVRADLTYQQGINKMFKRSTRYDFYLPTFANLGEQAVLNGEIYHQRSSVDDGVFGYQERWAEYRHYPSKISGAMRSSANLSLDTWHLSQDFGSLPVLNSDFIEEDVPLERVLTYVSDGMDSIPEIIFDSYIEIKHARPMPTFSVPGLGRL